MDDLDMASYVDDDENTLYTFFQELDATLKRLKNYTEETSLADFKNKIKT